MPPIKVSCPECEAVIKVQVQEGTTAIKCPKCQGKVPVRLRQNPPGSGQAPPPKKTATNASQAAPPTPKGKKKKKRPASADNTQRNVLIGVVVVVLVGIGVFFALRPREQAPVAAEPKTVDLSSATAADFLPANGQMVLRLRVEKLLGEVSKFPNVQQQIDQQLAKLGENSVDPRKIDEVYVVKNPDQHFSAFVFSQPIDLEAYLAAARNRFTSSTASQANLGTPQSTVNAEDHNGVQIYHSEADQIYFVFAHPKLVVTCSSKSGLTAAIDRFLKGERTGFQISDESTVSLSVQDPAGLLANAPALASLGVNANGPETDWTKSIRSARLQMDVTGDGLVGKFVAEAGDEAAAAEINKQLSTQITRVQALLAVAQMMAPKAENAAEPQSQPAQPAAPLKLSQNGNSVAVDVNLSASLIQSLASMGGGPAQPAASPGAIPPPSLGETGIPAVPPATP